MTHQPATTRSPIGARASIRYRNEPEAASGYYFSFGEYNVQDEVDSFGVPDTAIFFYAEGEQEMKELKAVGNFEFKVTDFELVFADDSV